MRTSGWVIFGSVMMVMIGTFMIINGLVAIINDEVYLVTEDQIVAFDFTTWGWIHLLLGVLVLCAGFAVTSGALWARIVGVFLALGSALSQIAFIQAYPFWSLTIIFLSVMVMYALLVHGEEEVSG